MGRFKIDVISMYWEAELDKSFHVIRWGVPDSSPQGHRNYFCCREDKVMFPLDADRVDCIQNRLHELWVSRSMVCTTLGPGRAKTADKLWRFLHAMLLETGPGQDAVVQRRMSYRGAGSDGGIEKALFDTPNVTSQNPDDIGSIIGQMILHEESIYDEEVKNTFLFPNLLYIPMVLHILYGAL